MTATDILEDREAQREGWPGDKEGKSPRSRFRAEVEERAEQMEEANAQKSDDETKRLRGNQKKS